MHIWKKFQKTAYINFDSGGNIFQIFEEDYNVQRILQMINIETGVNKQGARAKDFELAIEWLLDCGLITKVYRVSKPAIPLKTYTDFAALLYLWK